MREGNGMRQVSSTDTEKQGLPNGTYMKGAYEPMVKAMLAESRIGDLNGWFSI